MRKKTNPKLRKLTEDLYKQGYEEKNKFLINLAKKLDKPTRQRAEVNLSRLQRVCKENDSVVVPGSVLAAGLLSKPLTVSAFRFSANSKDKIKKAGGTTLTIRELIKRNPKGTKVRLIS